MREIKFRAWLLKENKIVSVDTISNNKGYGGALEIFVDNPLFDPTKKYWCKENRIHDSYLNYSMEVHKERNNGDDFILMQYTGLKDKNGKEIYEGDIVEVPQKNYRAFLAAGQSGDEEIENSKPYFLIEWQDDAFSVMAKRINDVIEYGQSAKGIYVLVAIGYNKDVEVIGNIYKNPELLKS